MSAELDLTEAIYAARDAIKREADRDRDDPQDMNVVMLNPESEYWDLYGVYSHSTTAIARLAVEAAAPLIAAKFHQTGRLTESTAVLASKDSQEIPAGNKVEHAQLMAGDDMHLWEDEPPDQLDQRVRRQLRFGGRVFRRTIVVIEDWTEVTDREGKTDGH